MSLSHGRTAGIGLAIAVTVAREPKLPVADGYWRNYAVHMF